MNTAVRMAASSIVGLLGFGVLLFVPAGTVHYWQGWVFIAVFTTVSTIPTVYLARTNPAALQRRMHAGPRAEGRTAQKIIVSASFLDMFAMMAFSALDHRFGWSAVPVWVCLLGEVLVAVGLGIALLVVVQNGYAAATVTVESGQPVVSTGLYGFVRHPMYFGDVIMMVGIPLALGSYWGLLFVVPGVVVLVFRILDEEELLRGELSGYREYTQRVRYRLLPSVW
ncbi:methyltransferase family protein [Mycobacterium sp. Marseille-P9652]|uniref:methyltransferase family protein n=1 Tax=Mycobacterium sp. Marseille-P9652 TaxID=2654950 RepID=UPI0012E95969|nr:isoprenylcysteine carboxylmethyltransferase family protein [Mycobacterium sp. Marseille-P9652]